MGHPPLLWFQHSEMLMIMMMVAHIFTNKNLNEMILIFPRKQTVACFLNCFLNKNKIKIHRNNFEDFHFQFSQFFFCYFLLLYVAFLVNKNTLEKI